MKRLFRSVMVVVFFVMALCCRADKPVDALGSVLYEIWPDFRWDDFKDGRALLSLPAKTETLTELNRWDRPEKVFTARMSALVRVPESGLYTFWLTSKGESQLYLSGDGTPDKLEMIMHLNINTNRLRPNRNNNAWMKAYRQESDPVPLEKGRVILLTALNYVWNGNPNHLTVGWSRNGGEIRPIDGAHCLSPWNAWGAFETARPKVFGSGSRFIEIEWPRTNLGLGITSFNVFRDGKLLAEKVTRYRYLDSKLTAGSRHRYAVQSVDLFGRKSPKSAEITAVAEAVAVAANGTGLTAGFYLPIPGRERDLDVRPQVRALVDSTCFLQNRKGSAVFRQGATPSFKWYRETVIDVPNFSRRPMRMEGFVEVPYSGQWTFHIVATDRLQFWVDGRLLVNKQFIADAWAGKELGVHRAKACIELKAGAKIPFRIESDYRTLQVEWEHALQKRSTIPLRYLYPSETLGRSGMSVVSADESYTSPAHLEIAVGSEVEGVSCTIGGNKKRVLRLNDYRRLIADANKLGVGLDPMAPVDVVLKLKRKEGDVSKRWNVRWKPIWLGRKNESLTQLTIRQGDELFFKNAETGRAAKAVTLRQDGAHSHVSTNGGRVAFNSPGVYEVDRGLAGTVPLTVRVISAVDRGVVPLVMGKFRYWSIPTELLNVHAEAADDRMVEVITSPSPKFSGRLILRGPFPGRAHLVFRTRPDGPVVAMVPTDTFRSWNHRFLPYRPMNAKWQLYVWQIMVSHFVPGVSVRMEAQTRNRLCENGHWYQNYPIVDRGTNLVDLPVAYKNGSGVGWIDNYYYHGDEWISMKYPGVEP